MQYLLLNTCTYYLLLTTCYLLLATYYLLPATHHSPLTTHLVLDDAQHVAGIGEYLQRRQQLLVVAQLVLLLVHDDGVRQVAHLAVRQ